MHTEPQKKILYIITKANWGGAQRYVYDLAVAAKDAGHEVAVVVGGTGLLTEKLTAAGIRVIPLTLRQRRTFLGDLLTFGSLFSLIRIFRAEHPAVVHVNSAKAGGLGALGARIARVPSIIFTAHGWEFNAPRGVLSRVGIRLFSWLTMLLAHRTIAVSEAIRRDVCSWPFIADRISVILLGISCGPLRSREEARALLAPYTVGKYWVGMLSELHPTKRIVDAISAFGILVPEHPEAILVVLGEGHEREMLVEHIRDLHLGNHVFLLGFKDNAASLLKAFDLFIHTSASEALGYAILEAGCAALPVIATNVGGIPEIISDVAHGTLVPPRDPEALAEAIRSLMREPNRAAELGARLHARVLHSFSKERMLSETLALYR